LEWVDEKDMTQSISSKEVLVVFTKQVMVKVGVPEADAEVVASTLVDADLRGIHSHGVSRLPIYVERIKRGLVSPVAKMRILSSAGATITIDGGDSLGPVLAKFAMEKCIEVARDQGVGVCTVMNANHVGMLGHFSEMAARLRMIGIVVCNAAPSMAPWGGMTPALGSNPMAISIPSGQEWPITLDISTSASARGKIRLAALRGTTIPYGWAVDSEGQPTQDPKKALEGSLLPFGEHKGYGLAVIMEILAGILSGANFGADLGSMYEMSKVSGIGIYLQTINISRFMRLDDFTARISKYGQMLKSVPKRPGFTQIYMPGEPEREISRKRAIEGIPLDDETVKELQRLARSLEIELPIHSV
jgi:LDH2 family malate/lactate/ureidoglycolate dehydrogenase